VVPEGDHRERIGETGLRGQERSPARPDRRHPQRVDLETGQEMSIPLDAGRVPVVGTAGPLEAVKGLPFFLGAASGSSLPDATSSFCRRGRPEEANLRRLARDLGIAEKVTFSPIC